MSRISEALKRAAAPGAVAHPSIPSAGGSSQPSEPSDASALDQYEGESKESLTRVESFKPEARVPPEPVVQQSIESHVGPRPAARVPAARPVVHRPQVTASRPHIQAVPKPADSAVQGKLAGRDLSP